MTTTIEVTLNGVVVLKGHVVEPGRFKEISQSVQGLWPGAVIQFEKQKKEQQSA